MSDTPTDTPHTPLKPLCIKRKLRVAFSKTIHLPIHLKGILQNYVNTIGKYKALKIWKIPQVQGGKKIRGKEAKFQKKNFAYSIYIYILYILYIIYYILFRYITSYISCPIFTFFSHKEKIKQNFWDFLLPCCQLGHILQTPSIPYMLYFKVYNRLMMVCL